MAMRKTATAAGFFKTRSLLLRAVLAPAACAVSLMVAGGCGSGNAQIRSLSQNDADRLNSRGNEFDTAQKDPPVKVETRFAAGRLAESQNAPEQALEQYKEALKIDPKHAQTLYRCGVVQTQMKQYT